MSSEQALSWKEVKERGLLLEVNRQFFHPRGMKLEINDQLEPVTRIIELLDDDEGYIFAEIDQEDIDRASALMKELDRRIPIRDKALGFVVQPLEITPSV